jgi:hypothetical protein
MSEHRDRDSTRKRRGNFSDATEEGVVAVVTSTNPSTSLQFWAA